MKQVFVYIWEYIVKEDHLVAFKKVYGPQGEWVQLFRKADGYIATDLHQDISNSKRFITVDFWNTKHDRDKFRVQFSEEFRMLDERCENYTEWEKLLGDFDCYNSRFSD